MHTLSRLVTTAAFAALALSCSAQAQVTLPVIADTFISIHEGLAPNAANTNFGSNVNLAVVSPATFFTYSLIQFDVSGFSAATGDAAIDLYATRVFSGGTPMRAYQVLTPWAENTVTWNNFGGAPGVQFGTDVATTAFASYAIPTQNVYNRYLIPQAIIQGWIDNPASNHGILLYGDTGRDNYYGSRESGSATAPRVQVNGITGAASAPEPSALALLVLPALGVIIGHRRKALSH